MLASASQAVLAEAAAAAASTATTINYLDHLNRAHDTARDGDAVAISRSGPKVYPIMKLSRKHSLNTCGPPPFGENSSGSRRATCADLLASRHSALSGVRLLLGITSPPQRHGQKQRNGIRRTWNAW